MTKDYEAIMAEMAALDAAQFEADISLAYNELLGGYRVDLLSLEKQIEREIVVAVENRRNHPTLYLEPVTDREIGIEAVQAWLGWPVEAAVEAVRRWQKEQEAER